MIGSRVVIEVYAIVGVELVYIIVDVGAADRYENGNGKMSSALDKGTNVEAGADGPGP